MGKEGWVRLGKGAEPRAPQGGMGQDTPSHMSAPGQQVGGDVLLIARQVAHPTHLTCSS